MNKDAIQKVRMDIVSGEQSALSLRLDRDGQIYRQGNGNLPVDAFAVESESDGSVFTQVLEAIDPQAFDHAGVYDHPDKRGVPIQVSLALLDTAGNTVYFEFRYGTETEAVGELLPYIDKLIADTIALTDYWYYLERNRHQGGDADGAGA